MSKATARRPLAVGMPVPVMDVRVVRVSVFERGVDVFVDMRFAGRIVRFVRMLVMFVVAVAVLVDQGVMQVKMVVPLGQMQPDPDQHQRAGHAQLPG